MTIADVRVLVGKQLGISEADARTPANLSQADSIKLSDYTFAYIATHPEGFTEQQVSIAKKMYDTWGINSPLLDTSFNWGMLADEIGNNVISAAEDVASAGKGVLNLASMGKWLIPVIGLSVAAIVVYKFYKAGDILPKLTK